MDENNQNKRISSIKQRRMFSMEVTDTDKFLDLPHSSQVLWFQCGMRADDDGFISNMGKIMKITNTTQDDLYLLIVKGYLIQMHKNVFLFAHWNLCNFVQKRAYAQSLHKNLLNFVQIAQNGIYTKCENISLFEQNPPQNLHKMHKNGDIGKVRLGKVSNICSCTSAQFVSFWDIYPKKINKKRAMQEWDKAKITEEEAKEILEHLQKRIKTDWIKQNKAFVVYPERFIKYRKWEDDISDYQPLQEQPSGELLDLSSNTLQL